MNILENILELIPKIIRPTPGEGEIICPECDGLLFVVHESGKPNAEGKRWVNIDRCGCGDGLVKLCRHCGAPDVYRSRTGMHECEGKMADRRAKQAEHELAKWRKHPARPWDSSPHTHIWSDRLDEYMVQTDCDELHDAWWEHCGSPEGDAPLPPIDPEWALLYACRPVNLTASVENILERWDDEHGGDDWSPFDEVSGEAIKELQAALDVWCKANAPECWEADYSHPLLPPTSEGGAR